MTDIAIVDGAGDHEIRKYLLQSRSALVYYEPRFLQLVSDHLEAGCGWLVARRNKTFVGLLPFLVKGGPLGPVFNSLAYYGSYGGVVQIEHDYDSKAALINAYFNMAADAEAVSATIISNPLEGDSGFYHSWGRADLRDERISQITHLPEQVDSLMARFDDPRPRNIRRAIREGVTVRKGSIEDIDFLYDTHVDNMTSIGGLAKNRDFFDAIPIKMLGDDWAIFTASLNGQPIAALLVFYFNKTVEYFTPVVLEAHRNTQALTLVIYEAMRDAIENGYANWNWGGTWPTQDGVYNFKKRWGTSQYQYFYYTRVLNQTLLSQKASFLLNCYPGFYLLPFASLPTGGRR